MQWIKILSFLKKRGRAPYGGRNPLPKATWALGVNRTLRSLTPRWVTCPQLLSAHNQNSSQESQSPGHLPASLFLWSSLTGSSQRHLFFWPSNIPSWLGPVLAPIPLSRNAFPQGSFSSGISVLRPWPPTPGGPSPHSLSHCVIAFTALTSLCNYVIVLFLLGPQEWELACLSFSGTCKSTWPRVNIQQLAGESTHTCWHLVLENASPDRNLMGKTGLFQNKVYLLAHKTIC